MAELCSSEGAEKAFRGWSRGAIAQKRAKKKSQTLVESSSTSEFRSLGLGLALAHRSSPPVSGPLRSRDLAFWYLCGFVMAGDDLIALIDLDA